jgi:hypothetical protein
MFSFKGYARVFAALFWANLRCVASRVRCIRNISTESKIMTITRKTPIAINPCCALSIYNIPPS